jgi:hypothetical protein
MKPQEVKMSDNPDNQPTPEGEPIVRESMIVFNNSRGLDDALVIKVNGTDIRKQNKTKYLFAWKKVSEIPEDWKKLTEKNMPKGIKIEVTRDDTPNTPTITVGYLVLCFKSR